MPIVINEIEIAVEVTSSANGAAGTTPPATDTQQIIKECVEQVLQILNDKKER